MSCISSMRLTPCAKATSRIEVSIYLPALLGPRMRSSTPSRCTFSLHPGMKGSTSSVMSAPSPVWTALAVVVALIGATLTAPPSAGAQSGAKTPRIGVFFASNPTATARNNEAFTQGLRERGYVEGQQIVLERRYAEGRAERMAEIAAE